MQDQDEWKCWISMYKGLSLSYMKFSERTAPSAVIDPWEFHCREQFDWEASFYPFRFYNFYQFSVSPSLLPPPPASIPSHFQRTSPSSSVAFSSILQVRTHSSAVHINQETTRLHNCWKRRYMTSTHDWLFFTESYIILIKKMKI